MFSWFGFLAYVVATAATPGPNNIMSMSNASRFGFRKSFPFNVGIWAGFSIVTVICTLFCSLLSSMIPRIKTPMLMLGAAYMLYLAWKTFQGSANMDGTDGQNSFAAGFLLQFINPKIYLYSVVSMEAYILPYYSRQPSSLFGFAMLLAFIGFLFTLCWSAFGAVFKLLFSKYARITNTIMALLLVYCAVMLFF